MKPPDCLNTTNFHIYENSGLTISYPWDSIKI